MTGIQNTLIGSVPHSALILAFDYGVTPISFMRYGPLATADNPIYAHPVGATSLFSRKRAPKNVTQLAAGDRFLVNGYPLHTRIILDGVLGTEETVDPAADDEPLTVAQFPNLINLVDVGDIDAITAAPELVLRNVVLMNGQELICRGNDDTLLGGDYKVVTDGGAVQLYVCAGEGIPYGAGTVLDIHMDFDDDQITEKVMATTAPFVAITGADFWVSDAENVIIQRDPA